jgi:hypothetical protein
MESLLEAALRAPWELRSREEQGFRYLNKILQMNPSKTIKETNHTHFYLGKVSGSYSITIANDGIILFQFLK